MLIPCPAGSFQRAGGVRDGGATVGNGPFWGAAGHFGTIRDANRDALQVARPWAWRRLLDGLPAAPRPEAVARPGRPFTLQIPSASGLAYLHSPDDPVREARDLVRAARLAHARAVVVLGFGAGYVVEQVLAAAPTGCEVIAAVLDPGAFEVTLAHRDLPGLIGDARLVLALGDEREITAALPATGPGIVRLLHAPLALAFSPSLAPLAGEAARLEVRRPSLWQRLRSRRSF